MDTITSTNTPAIKTVDLDVVKSALDRLKQRNDKQEIVLSEFPVMQGYSIIPRNAIEDLLSSEGKKANSELIAKFSGEIFSSDKLLQLTRVRDSVTKRLCSYGTIVGKCCTYVVATEDHTEIVDFLSEMKDKYDMIVNDMLNNYDRIVSEHIQKLNENIPNEQARNALIAKIPSKEKIEERHVAQFRFFKGYCPDEDDLHQSASEILAAVELARKQDLAFVEKVAELFKQFLDAPKNADSLGKRYSAFCNAVQTGLSYERSTKLIMAGSQYEHIANAQFELLHQAHANLVAYNPTRTEKDKLARVLNDKFKQIAYVLSDSKELMAFAHGNITVFEGADFIRQSLQSLTKVPRTRSIKGTTYIDKIAQVADDNDSDKVETTAPEQVATAQQNAESTNSTVAEQLVESEKVSVAEQVSKPEQTVVSESTATAQQVSVPEQTAVPQNTVSDTASFDFGAGESIDNFSFEDLFEETPKAVETPKAETTVPQQATAEPAKMTKEEKLSNIEAALAELMGSSVAQDEKQNYVNPDNIAVPEDDAGFIF